MNLVKTYIIYTFPKRERKKKRKIEKEKEKERERDYLTYPNLAMTY